ncbi:hypothetical protein W97_08517 [Coniosporium apollinis CBS 100218]|uniref:Uncharacterized protein n=1 Tax=Coniosporium apollinis (strain CBS 100218) TaxID=1168221 RepID=R7Z584_CONA1|nr:uncharacterized protein W97_08517 [Coniosporium apollinis CBS 100218]EON69159.1 hypothetical protein W97_08517 [Coniosporium apollinis CBS 100218]
MFYPKAPNVFETPGSKQIGDRWSAAGGKDTHTPGAATRRGDPDHVEPNQVKGGGIDSKHFQERVADQRPGDPGIFDKKWNKAHYGNPPQPLTLGIACD